MNAPAKLQVKWEGHLKALPLATWILSAEALPRCNPRTATAGPVFFNQACRELLGFSDQAPAEDLWLRYIHPEDQQAVQAAWADFVDGRSARFEKILRWIRPDSKEIVTLAARAQKLLCGDIQGWLRSAAAEAALSKLEGLIHARP
jgi:PAS domain-containing protein